MTSLPPSSLRRRRAATATALLVGCAAASLGGCRIEHRAPSAQAGAGTSPAANSFENKAFDPKAQVSDIWASKVLPTLKGKAGSFPDLQAAMQANLDEAGAKYGHRERGEGAPWNFATTLKGRIVEANTESSAAKLGVDVNGDGKADVEVQIGPVLRGTAIRDSLPFISFTNYTNQVEFAQLANAFNDEAFKTALKDLPRATLKGRNVELLGAFTSGDATATPVITPVQLTLGDPS